uniref:Uncharacterized protein n=1 Tax=Peronospora matthiolae TaxID=2874970 RepID=A0AAV1TDA3_9STRA
MSAPIQGAAGGVLDRDDFQHLTTFEWEALRSFEVFAGISAVVAVLKDTPEHLQLVTIQGFVDRELTDFRQRALTFTVVKTSDVVKLDVYSYSGEGSKLVALNRWLYKVDIIIQARQLTSEFSRNHFLHFELTGW